LKRDYRLFVSRSREYFSILDLPAGLAVSKLLSFTVGQLKPIIQESSLGSLSLKLCIIG
jgi:hypothetical protein